MLEVCRFHPQRGGEHARAFDPATLGADHDREPGSCGADTDAASGDGWAGANRWRGDHRCRLADYGGDGDQQADVMNDDVLVVPAEIRILVVTEEKWVIVVPAEHRVIEVPSDVAGQ